MKNSVFYKYRWQFIAAAFSIFLFLLGYGIAAANLSIQIKAFQNQIKNEEVNDQSVSHSRLIIKYIKQKELFTGKIDRDTLDIKEFQYNRLILKTDKNENTAAKLSLNESAVLAMINTYRFLTGYKLILIDQNSDTYYEIFSAYNLEKMREYRAAIDIYKKNLMNQPDSITRGNLYLHIGYCYAMLEEDEAARSYYKDIISIYKGTDLSIVASILLRYLEMFGQERALVLHSDSTSLEKGEKLSILLSQKTALRIMESFQSKDPDEMARLNFTKGICYEELGEKLKAIDSYLASIKNSLHARSARYANRRIYTIASDLRNNNNIIQTCVKIAEKQNDKVLIELDHKFRKEITTSAKEGDISPITSEQIIQAVESSEILAKESNKPVSSAIFPSEPMKVKIVNEFVSSMTGKEVLVETISNEIFSGRLLNSEKEDTIRIDTLIGIIRISKDKIKTMEAKIK